MLSKIALNITFFKNTASSLNNPLHSLLALTHSGKVLVSGSDPEGSVGGAVPQDHALWDGTAVDESFVSLPVEARWVPAPLHHLNRHPCDCKLVPVRHLRRLMDKKFNP